MPTAFALRKARPPLSTSPMVVTADGSVRCTALYEPANGTPLCAILVPMQRHANGRWLLMDADGQVIEAPTAQDVTSTPGPTVATRVGIDPAVVVHLPWPTSARHALLLLLHTQGEGVGDHLFDLRRLTFGPRDPALAPELGESALHRASAAPAPTTEPPTCIAAAAQIRRAVIAYLGETARDDAGVIRRPLAARPGAPGVPIASASMAQAAQSPARAEPAAARSAAPIAVAPSRLAFALASCQYPAGIVDGSFRRLDPTNPIDADIAPADRSLRRLATRFEHDPTLSFALLTGDQVYVDATAGLFDARTLQVGLTVAYQRLRNHQGMSQLARSGLHGIVALMDDHEVVDNWEPLPAPRPADDKQSRVVPARKAFVEQQRNFWWPGPAHSDKDPLFEPRTIDGFSFFLADTRTERDGRDGGNWRDASILGTVQQRALEQWIDAQGGTDRPVFLASSSILLPRPLCVVDRPTMAQHIDGWCGYPNSLHALLARACEADVRRLVCLSGDEHLGCVARIVVRDVCRHDRQLTVHSIHACSLYAPYPFANARVEDFADGGDRFEFKHPDAEGRLRHYECTVDADFPEPGDGFALVAVECHDGLWKLSVTFDRDGTSWTRDWPL